MACSIFNRDACHIILDSVFAIVINDGFPVSLGHFLIFPNVISHLDAMVEEQWNLLSDFSLALVCTCNNNTLQGN